MTGSRWPDARVDPVMRLRALAAAIPGSAVTETFIAAPLDVVWAVASDLEAELLHFIPDVRSVRLIPGPSDRSVALIRGRSGLRGRFDVVLRPGWCVMQSRFVIGAMAATPAPGGTIFAGLGALRLPAARTLTPLLSAAGQPLGARAARRLRQRVEQRMSTS